MFRCLIITIQYIKNASTKTKKVFVSAIFFNWIIRCVRGGCHPDFIHIQRLLCPFYHPMQDRQSANFLHHLARQAAGSHSGLDNTNDLIASSFKSHQTPSNAISYAVRSLGKFSSQSALSSAISLDRFRISKS